MVTTSASAVCQFCVADAGHRSGPGQFISLSFDSGGLAALAVSAWLAGSAGKLSVLAFIWIEYLAPDQ